MSTFFILEDPSVEGFSGAPVYALSGTYLGGANLNAGPFACVGLVHGAFKDKTGGKFAAITPAWLIIDAIEKSEKDKSQTITPN